MHDEISNEVQNISEWDGLPMTFSSRAPFNKNERIIGESTNGQITSEVMIISFAVKQSSCCLNKEEKGEFSELSKFMRTIRGLHALSFERLLPKGLEVPRPLGLLEGSFISTHKVRVSIVTALKTNDWRIFLSLTNNTKRVSFWMVYCVVSYNILINGIS